MCETRARAPHPVPLVRRLMKRPSQIGRLEYIPIRGNLSRAKIFRSSPRRRGPITTADRGKKRQVQRRSRETRGQGVWVPARACHRAALCADPLAGTTGMRSTRARHISHTVVVQTAMPGHDNFTAPAIRRAPEASRRCRGGRRDDRSPRKRGTANPCSCKYELRSTACCRRSLQLPHC